ncbi:hypothetical protein V5O48_008585 [Marasmius crinis-equi]|uniref:F-box domain-containing protein n=1 Tax=Marasmius crinis-equi TaxID=585013 RepID=A0ABR3FDU2_9AGAR
MVIRRLPAPPIDMDPYLPTELWRKIFTSDLPDKDLVHVCLTSRHFLHIARSVLYRSLRLSQIRDDIQGSTTGSPSNTSQQQTLSLLMQDDGVARAVSELILSGKPSGSASTPQAAFGLVPDLVDASHLKRMTNLKRLAIRDRVFAQRSSGQDNEQDPIVQILDALHQLPLEGLGVELGGWLTRLSARQLVGRQLQRPESIMGRSLGLPGEPFLALDRLRSLQWFSCVAPSVLEPLWCILSASTSTLRHLSLHLLSFNLESQQHLFNRRFPSLETLSLRESAFTTPLLDSFAAFIQRHNKICHLSLHGADSPRSLAFISSMLPTFTPDALPRLERFCGSVECVQVMIQAHMRCLSETLKSLDIRNPSTTTNGGAEGLSNVQLGALDRPMAALKKLSIPLATQSRGKGALYMSWWELFVDTALEVLEISSIDRPYGAEELGSMISGFGNGTLREVRFPCRIVGGEDAREWVEQFTDHCSGVLEVVLVP